MSLIVLLAFALLVTLFGPIAAVAQPVDYPNRPLHVVVSWSTGGATDLFARLMAKELEAELGQTVIVENKPGASGVLGVNRVLSAKPDGYTMLFGDARIFHLNWKTLKTIPYTPESFAYGDGLARAPFVIAVHKDAPIQNGTELKAWLQAKGTNIDFVTAGINSPHHAILSDIEAKLGTRLTHIPMKGDSEAIVELLSGRVDMGVFGPITVASHLSNPALRPVATVWPTRLAAFKDVPTLDELGIKDVRRIAEIGWLFPKGTSPEAIDVINQASRVILARPEIIRQLEAIGFVPEHQSPTQLHAKTLESAKDAVP